ncbi:MAG: permease [Balneolaceae bacterium]|nr:permease [Balneolaceae bacterium]
MPQPFWTTLFLANAQHLPAWIIAFENALIAPFVAAATFIGPMGNIPLATVLNGNGVLFAGIMGFIYSDLMVPPLVHINAKYYGWRVALYIAGVMYISIVITALILNGLFSVLGIIPESQKAIADITQFKIDYTFWMNLVFVWIAAWLVWQNKRYLQDHEMKMMQMEGWGALKRAVVYLFILVNVIGLSAFLYTQTL